MLAIQTDKHIWQEMSAKVCVASHHSGTHKQTQALELAGANL